MLPNTPMILAKARGTRMMSTSCSDWKAARKVPGMAVTMPISPDSAPSNHA